MLRTALINIAAALAEIGSCDGFWLWLREGRSPWLYPATCFR